MRLCNMEKKVKWRFMSFFFSCSYVIGRNLWACLYQSYKAVFDRNLPIPWTTSVVVLCHTTTKDWTLSHVSRDKRAEPAALSCTQSPCFTRAPELSRRVERGKIRLQHSHTTQMLWKRLESMWWPPGSQIVEVISGHGS